MASLVVAFLFVFAYLFFDCLFRAFHQAGRLMSAAQASAAARAGSL
jgi:hypothetical protein